MPAGAGRPDMAQYVVIQLELPAGESRIGRVLDVGEMRIDAAQSTFLLSRFFSRVIALSGSSPSRLVPVSIFTWIRALRFNLAAALNSQRR